MVAYLEITSKTRVLQIDVDYTEVDFEPIILNLTKLIICDVPP